LAVSIAGSEKNTIFTIGKPQSGC